MGKINGKEKDGKYEDLFFEGPLEGVKKIEPVDGIQDNPPKIRWGEQYKSWSSEKKITYLEKFANSMNHAADVLQQERNKLLILLQRKEDQIKSLSERITNQGQLMNSELQKANEREQILNTTVVELQNTIKNQQTEIEHLRGGREITEGE